MALSEWDKQHLNANQQRAVLTYTAEWEKAKREGNTARMEWAHNGAEAIRRQAGYSGGGDGGSFMPSANNVANADVKVTAGTVKSGGTTTTTTKSSSSTGKGYDNGSLTKAQVKTLQAALGVDQDGFFGPKTQAAAFQRWGTSSADAAMQYYNTPTTPARTSFDFDPDEGTYHWNGQTFNTKAALTDAMNSAGLSAAEKNIIDRKATNSGAGVQLQGGSFSSTTPKTSGIGTNAAATTANKSTFQNPLAPGRNGSPSAQGSTSTSSASSTTTKPAGISGQDWAYRLRQQKTGSGVLEEPLYLEAPDAGRSAAEIQKELAAAKASLNNARGAARRNEAQKLVNSLEKELEAANAETRRQLDTVTQQLKETRTALGKVAGRSGYEEHREFDRLTQQERELESQRRSLTSELTKNGGKLTTQEKLANFGTGVADFVDSVISGGDSAWGGVFGALTMVDEATGNAANKVKNAVTGNKTESEPFVSPFREYAQYHNEKAADTLQRTTDGRSDLGKRVMQTGQAVGNMLASSSLSGLTAGTGMGMGATFATSEAGLGASAAQKALTNVANVAAKFGNEILTHQTNALISAGSAGHKYLDATDRGADQSKAMANAILSGLLEYESNKMFSGTPLEDTGEKGYVTKLIEYAADKLGKSEALGTFLNSAFGKGAGIVFDKTGEGLEEVITAIGDPILERITWNPEADRATVDEVVDSFIGGLSLSLMMSGGEALIDNAAKARDRVRGALSNGAAPSQNATQGGPLYIGDDSPAVQEDVSRHTEQQRTQTPTTPARVGDTRTAAPAPGNLTPAANAGVEARISPQSDTDPASHIDNRDMESVKPRSVNAFQFDHPELHQYFVGAAQALIADADASLSQPNSRQRVYGQQGRKFNQSAQTSPQLRSAMDDANLSRGQIIDAAERIVNNHGQENVAAAKKLELILDDMLSNGYTTMYGENVAPNADYLAAKQGIAGARIGPAAGSFEQYVAENRLALETGEVTMDGLRAEWEAEQQKAAPEGTAFNGYNAPRYEVSALTAETDNQRVQRLTSDAMQITRAKQDSGKAFDLGKLKNIRATDATKYLMPILQKLGITGRSYDNAALDISFEYSNNGAKRSIEHQSRDVGRDYRGFAIVQNNLEDLCKNAYPIEAHLDEKPKTADSHVTQVATLGSVLETAEGYIPVKMSVKFYDNETPKLHVIINELTPLSDVWTPEAHITSGSEPATISVADYFRIVNNNEEFLKRVPDALNPLYLGDDSAAVQEDLARSRGVADSLTAEDPLYLEDPADLGLGDDGLGAADANSVNTDYDRLQAQSDKFHPSGPDPVRHTDVPTTNFDGRNIPKSTSTIYGAQGTPDAAVMQLEQMIADGTLAFDTITDKDAIASARTTMERKGFEGALEQYRNTVASNAVSKNNTALGQQLLLQAMREGNTAATAELLTLYTRNSTNTAQALQAESIFRKLSPEGQLTAVQRAIDSFNEKHDTDVQMSEEDINDFVNAESEAEREAVRQRILENVASAVPGTFKAKYDAIRYLAMLGNPRTHIRNILGNTLFQAPVTVKNRVGAVEEIIANAVSGGKVERTKSLTGVSPFGSLAKEARADFDNVKELLGQTHKYIDGQTSLYDIEENIKAFSNGNIVGRGMNALAEGNSYLLEAEDTMAKKFIYTQSLAGYLRANGVKTMQGLADTLEGRQLLDRARNYAAQEAMRNTFNDKNAASDAVVKLGGLYRSENPVARGFGYVVEGVLPFKRTPTNILVRALEYSPAGAAAGIVQTIQGAKAGDSARVTQGLDRMAAGMTGTGLMYLGAVLAGAGLIRGGDDDDEKQAKFDDLRGHQNYSVELSDGTSVTLDWLAPEAIPFFMGVELYNAALDGGVTFEDFQQTFRDATAPMLEMSMLQGLNNTFDNAAYAKNSGGSVAGAVLTSALTNYLTQMFPTLFGQAERSFGESERMATYTDKNSSVPSDLQYTLGKVSQKIPGWDYNQIPYIDAWGRTESTGGTGQRAANNFLNPAFISQISDDAVENELQRLYDATGEAGVLPQRAVKYFTADGVRKDLTGEEYVAYATAKGQLSRELITEFLNSDGYAQMDDAAKANAISDLYSYANAKAKESVFGIGLNSTAAKIQAAVDSGISPAQYFTFNAKLDALTPLEGAKGVSDMQRFRVIAGEDMGDDEKLAAIGSIMGTDMTTESGGKSQYAKMLDVLDTGATLDQYLDLSDAGAIDNYLKYQSAQGDRDYGIEPEAFAQFQTGKSQYDADGNNSYTQKEVAAAIEGIFGDTLTAEQKAVIWQLYNKSWKSKNNPYSSEIGGLIYDSLHEEPLYLDAP